MRKVREHRVEELTVVEPDVDFEPLFQFKPLFVALKDLSFLNMAEKCCI